MVGLLGRCHAEPHADGVVGGLERVQCGGRGNGRRLSQQPHDARNVLDPVHANKHAIHSPKRGEHLHCLGGQLFGHGRLRIAQARLAERRELRLELIEVLTLHLAVQRRLGGEAQHSPQLPVEAIQRAVRQSGQAVLPRQLDECGSCQAAFPVHSRARGTARGVRLQERLWLCEIQRELHDFEVVSLWQQLQEVGKQQVLRITGAQRVEGRSDAVPRHTAALDLEFQVGEGARNATVDLLHVHSGRARGKLRAMQEQHVDALQPQARKTARDLLLDPSRLQAVPSVAAYLRYSPERTRCHQPQ
mmetsp:Transcript_3456/g.9399  ORF Transcript_3456/g.9399 Transcript_3456/m.9399 type:complete len:303 (+) Transcript_3456:103-1011(+)